MKQTGFDPQPASSPVFMKKEIALDDGSSWKPKRVERPFALTDTQGRPIMIYVEISYGDTNGHIAMPILSGTP